MTKLRLPTFHTTPIPMPRKRRGRPRRMAAAPTAVPPTPASESSATLEFRSTVDDAWYSSRLQLEGETLRVMFIEFPETDDERFPASQFVTAAAIEEFRGRFRPESVPVEDEKCAEVVEGTVVCASNKYREIELKFYDAIVDSVLRAHRGGKCLCTFNLLWQHGPLDKKKTVASIDGICLIQSRGSQVDPVLDSFLDLARSKVEARNTEVGNFPESLRQGIESMRCDIGGSNTKVTTCTGGNTGSLGHKPLEFQSSACRFEEMTPTTGVKRTFGKKHYSRTVQDMDLGTSIKRKADPPECFFFFRVSNLEKDITAVCIMDFIFEQTTISSVAFVIPSSLPESFSTGTIFVETKEKSEELSKFLLNPGHLIMSLRGRPWVLNAKWNGSVEGRMPKYEWQSVKGKKGEHIGKLKLVTPEVKGYVMALELQKLHMEYLDYTEGLHDTLEREMKKIASRFPLPGST